VHIGDREVTSLPPGARDVAMVFQEHALYPHMTVSANIAFPLLARKAPADEVETAVRKSAEMMDLSGVLDRYPSQLSGGERRRASLARAVVREPAAFLMDEPLSSLDVSLRLKIRTEIKRLHAQLGVATIYVTHDQVEAMTLGQRIVVLKNGAVEQTGTPTDLYDRPANVFVAGFLGRFPINLFDERAVALPSGAKVLGVRPEDTTLTQPGVGPISGHVIEIDRLGSESVVTVQSESFQARVLVGSGDEPEPGTEVGLAFKESAVHAFDPADRRIG
jgi:ABC-type sugar transport system ATPase subunit